MLPVDKFLKNSAGVDVRDVGNTFYLESLIEPSLLDKLNAKTTQILQRERKVDYSSSLAGKIYDGEQVFVEQNDFLDSPLEDLKQAILGLSNGYTTRFTERINHNQSKRVEFSYRHELNDLWIVNQKAHDYNPPHSHRTNAIAGLSGVVYLKVPPQIDGKSPDGCFQFTYGPMVQHDYMRFHFAERRLVLPKPGLIILFPKTMCHEVFPYRGDGERRCIAFNVNCFHEGPNGLR